MAVEVKVLLVDDNATIAGMLGRAVHSPVAEVTILTDAADALLHVVDDAPDLVVADFRMAGMDGRQLVQKLKARPQTARIPVVLLASKADISEKLRGSLQDAVEDFIEKPFFLRDASSRIKRIVDRIALEKMAKQAPASDGVLRGTLEQMNVIDLLQSLELGRKTCLLTLTSSGEQSQLYFSEGQIVDAISGSLRGDAAAIKGIAWTQGDFQIDFAKESGESTTTLSTQALLMEGLRLLDEANRDSETAPSDESANPESAAVSSSVPEQAGGEDNILET